MANEVTIEKIGAIWKMFLDYKRARTEIEKDRLIAQSNKLYNKGLLQKIDEITQNGKIYPKVISFSAQNSDFCNDVIDKLNTYNSTHEDTVNFITFTDENGKQVIWTDEHGLDLIEQFEKEISIEKGTFLAEIDADDFNNGLNGKKATIIKGLPEEQIDYITNRNWKNDFTFGTAKQEDGTIDIGVVATKFMDGKTSPETEDLFTSLIRLNLTYDDKVRDIIKFDNTLEEKAFSYDKEDPMFICSANANNQFLQINKDGFTLYETHSDMGNTDLGIVKSMKLNEMNPKEYEKELYKAICNINKPIEVTKENIKIVNPTCKKDEITSRDLKEACAFHCQTGNSLKRLRPKEPNYFANKNLDRLAKAYGDVLEREIFKMDAHLNAQIYKAELSKYKIPESKIENITKKFEDMLANERATFMTQDEMYTSFFKLLTSEIPLTKEEKIEINKMLQNKEELSMADTLNDPTLFKQAVKNTTELLKNAEKAPTKEWDNVIERLGAENIPYDKLEKAAIDVLDLNISTIEVSKDSPALTGDNRGIKDYRYNPNFDIDEERDTDVEDMMI